MKKLMILGGSHYILPVIKKAKAMGIYVITCDYLPDNFAHKYSDQYVNVSIIDKDAVLEVAKKLNIDGIMSFACDPGVVTAAYVAEKLGLPTSGPLESVEILQNKGKFRKFLADNGFNVPVAKGYNKIEDAIHDVDLFNWPVIVKPVDSAGSKGVTRVDDKSKLEEAIIHALDFSHCNEFIIEDFLEQEGYSSDCDSFSLDGKMVITTFGSQMFDKECENPYTPAGMFWPCAMDKAHQEELKNEIQRLITLLHMGTSIYNIETRVAKNGKTYIMEVSPRGGGNRLAEMVNIVYGVDLIDAYIKHCVGIKVDNSFIVGEQKQIVELMLHSKIEGTFKSLFIDNEFKNNVIENDLWINQGDFVGGFKGANETIGTLVLKFDDNETKQHFLKYQGKFVGVNLND